MPTRCEKRRLHSNRQTCLHAIYRIGVVVKQIKITALVTVIYLLGSLVAAQEGEVGGESSGNRVPTPGPP